MTHERATQNMFVPYLHLLCITTLFHYSLSTTETTTTTTTASLKPPTPLAPALYVFGDSLLDSGNNNLLPTLARANYHPYGVDFANGATGRFTNGRTVADFIAEYLGLPYPPPILGHPQPDPHKGFNYASAACGILNETGAHMGRCLNLEEQINLFMDTVERAKKYYKKAGDVSTHFSKSIFIFSIGNNDYINNYMDPTYPTSLLYTPLQFSRVLIQHLSQKLKKLYKLGARKVLFFELGAIGCTPSMTKTTKHKGLCNEDINHMVSLFNYRLRSLLSNLSYTLPRSHFVLGQVYRLAYDAVINPSNYGLRNSRDPCCIAWFNGTRSCIPQLRPCKNNDKHFFWDAAHLTEIVCSIIASRCIKDSSICVPMNVQQLVKV